MQAVLRRQGILLWSFTRRDLKFRFAGSVLGSGWTLLGPVILLGIYSMVFGRIFSQQDPGNLSGAASYTAYVAVALWPWMMFSDGLLRGTTSIQQNASIVKKIAFPHSFLVISAVTAVFLQHATGYILVLALLQLAGLFQIHLLGIFVAIPILIVLYVLTIGLALFFAAIQTMLKDVEQAMAPALMMLLFLTPVMYPSTLVPESARSFIDINPLAIVVTQLRLALFGGNGAVAQDLIVALVAVAASLIGYALFARLSPYFEDFL